MSKRIKDIKEQIRGRIDSGATGFIDGIPSIRDLMSILGESRHIVNAALKELEDQGFLLCTAQKGFRVNPVVKKSPAISHKSAIKVVVNEFMPWQIDFWCKVITAFEKLNPQYKVQPYFVRTEKQLAKILHAGNGEPTVIIHFQDGDDNEIPLVPLAEIKRLCGSDLNHDDLLPALQRVSDPYTIPYQIQPAMVFYNSGNNPPVPSENWSLIDFLKWVNDNFGRSSTSPINTNFLGEVMGIANVNQLDHKVIRGKLEYLIDAIVFVRDHQLFYYDSVPPSQVQTIRQLSTGSVNVAIKNSFYTRAILSGGPGNKSFSVFAPPLEDKAMVSPPLCRLAMAGLSCDQASAKFFQYILDEKTQLKMMKEGVGVSPFRSFGQKAVESPDELIPGFAAVVRQAMERSEFLSLQEHSVDSEEKKFITHLLTDKIILPVLTGTCNRNYEKLISDYMTKLDEFNSSLPAEPQMEILRKQLLASY